MEIDTSSPTLDGVLYTGMIKRHATLNTIADLMNLTNDVVLHGGRRRDPGGAEIGMTLRCVGGCPREAGNPLFQLK